jgi:hypothetical protein
MDTGRPYPILFVCYCCSIIIMVIIIYDLKHSKYQKHSNKILSEKIMVWIFNHDDIDNIHKLPESLSTCENKNTRYCASQTAPK